MATADSGSQIDCCARLKRLKDDVRGMYLIVWNLAIIAGEDEDFDFPKDIPEDQKQRLRNALEALKNKLS